MHPNICVVSGAEIGLAFHKFLGRDAVEAEQTLLQVIHCSQVNS